jgi:hypothetical protein
VRKRKWERRSRYRRVENIQMSFRGTRYENSAYSCKQNSELPGFHKRREFIGNMNN